MDADLSIVAWGLLALFSLLSPVLVPGYEQYTGLSWAALTQDAPETASFFSWRSAWWELSTWPSAIPLIAIALTALGARERWAWWTLLVGNTIALGAPVAYDQLTGAIGVFEIGEWVVLGAVYAALAFTWRRGTRSRVVPVGQPVEQDVLGDPG